MKKMVCLALIAALAVSFAFAGGGKDKASNKVVIYTSMYENVVKSVQEDLRGAFPKYSIEFVTGGTGRLEHRVEAEKASGRLGCDMLMVAEPSYSLQLKGEGLLHPYLSNEATRLAFEYDKEGYWYPVRINNMVLAFNPAKNARNTLPQSFYDFAYDAKVSGAIAIRNPSISGTSMAALAALKDKYGYEYFNALSRQGIRITYGNEGITKLETGEYKIIMVLEESILQRREQGYRLEVIYPTDGTIMIPSTIMIINDKWSANRNAAAAEKITDWFLGEKGQHAIVDGWMHSVRIDFPRIPHDSKPTVDIRENSIPVHWENHFNEHDEIVSQFEEQLSNRK